MDVCSNQASWKMLYVEKAKYVSLQEWWQSLEYHKTIAMVHANLLFDFFRAKNVITIGLKYVPHHKLMHISKPPF